MRSPISRLRIPRPLREPLIALATAAAVLVVLVQLGDMAAVRGLETGSLDLRFRLRGPKPPGRDIAIIQVDDRSLAALGRWPLSRRIFARGLRALAESGAKAVVFDMLFTEPEQPLPEDLRQAARTAADQLPAGAAADLRQALRHLAGDDPDGDFEQALKAYGKAVLPIAFTFAGPPGTAPESLQPSAYQSFDQSSRTPVFPLLPISALLPVARLAQASDGLGSVNTAFDRDGAARFDYLAWSYDGDLYPSIAVRAVAEYLGVPWDQVALAPGADVRIGPVTVPANAAMRLVVNYRGPRGTFPTYSFLDLIQGRVPAEALRGRLVLVGASFIGNPDSFTAPFGRAELTGTERWASIIQSMLTRDFIIEMPAAESALALGAALALAAAVGAAAAVLPIGWSVLVGIGALAAFAGGEQAAFARGLWLPMVAPLAALLLSTITVLLFRYWVVDREGRRITDSFQHYLSPEMVKLLAANPERLRLGGETRPLTIMFCDIRGFTTISEGFKTDPQGLTQLINRFLTPMTDVIMERRGTIDKYMGDAIMAFWNAPLDDPGHAAHAADAALSMLAALDHLNQALAREAVPARQPARELHIGIGLNSGDCVVGNMGSDRRFDYSVLGDAVNLASRLEGQSKLYGVDIVIGEATRALIPDWAALELDLIAVKGKTEAVRIFALLGRPEDAAAPGHRRLAERHAALIQAYRAQDWAAARCLLDECRSLNTRLSKLYDLYSARLDLFEHDPPGPGWDGVFVAQTK